jgi:1-acyl-sn-glycerol-3-phosphate acyltransferase
MFVLRALMVLLATIFFGSISLVVSFFDSTGRRQNGVAQAWARALLWIGGVKVRVEGIEKISTDSGYVIASNHASYMDTPVVLANIPVQFRFLAKRGLFKIPFLGTHLARAGHIPVPREDPRASVRTMTLAAQIIRERGISMLVFPEGGRSRRGELRPFKEGAAYIGIKAGAPIVPVALIGTRQVLPFGSGHIRPGEVIVKVGRPIDTTNLTLRDRSRVTNEIRAQIVSMLGLASDVVSTETSRGSSSPR